MSPSSRIPKESSLKDIGRGGNPTVNKPAPPGHVTAGTPTLGVEEEFLLCDPHTGRPSLRNTEVTAACTSETSMTNCANRAPSPRTLPHVPDVNSSQCEPRCTTHPRTRSPRHRDISRWLSSSVPSPPAYCAAATCTSVWRTVNKQCGSSTTCARGSCSDGGRAPGRRRTPSGLLASGPRRTHRMWVGRR